VKGNNIRPVGTPESPPIQISPFTTDGKLFVAEIGYKPRIINAETGKDVTP
jgi:hypothetical protein